MGCVNKSSHEFKNLAARFNLADNQLELIIHKYWLETGNETLFPTDVYIQTQLGQTQYEESGKSVRKLWSLRYSSPQEFSSYAALHSAYNEALRYFPLSAVSWYRNANNNFVLSVKQPVAKINHNKEQFFYALDNMLSANDIKHNIGIKEGTTYTVNTLQSLYHRFNSDRTIKHLADRVFSIAKDLGLQVYFNDSLPFGKIGRYTNNNTITFKKSFFEGTAMNDMKAPIILHELLHAISMYALSGQTANWKRPEALEQFHTEMNSLYQDLKSNPLLKGERGIVDVNEFVAELSNPVFRGKIQEIDKQNKAKKSFWSRVLDAFKFLLGVHVTDSYYQRSMNALDKALGAFDIDSYMRYNGIKSQLRKEVANNTINQKNQRLENKNTLKYDKAIKSAGELFLQVYRSLQEGEQKYSRENEGKTDDGKSLRERSHEEAVRQQKQIIDWAEKNHQLIYEPNDYYDEMFNDQSLHGTESKVWVDQRKGIVIKSISPNHYQNIKALLDRIAIHNMVFPSTTMTLKKVGTSDKGISLIVEQPLVEDSGNIPTIQEIQDYMTKTLGFTLTKGKGINAEYTKDGCLVTDIRPENVIKQPDGSLAVIDCFAKFEDEAVVNSDEDIKQMFIKSMSPSQLKDETDLIKQESADYDLVNHVEEEKKHSSMAVPQDFTFNDGVKVKAPFMPNVQQIDALNAMSDFIKSKETSMTLSGYAGTGKTSLMEMIAKKCQKQHKPVVFCATTNKAAAVLNERVSKANFKASTLNKVFGISVEVDEKSNTYNARNLVNVLKDNDISPGTTVIIDEASMINEENYDILNDIAKDNNLKIIYVGDEAQLAPVGEDKISKVFRNGDGKVIRLTQVERTNDNAILKEATDLRNGKSLSGVSSFNSKGEGVAYISPQHQDAVNEVVEHYIKDLKKDPNYFRILAFTNKAVSSYNNQVRELLGYTSPTPQVGEPMTGYTNWGYEWRTRSYRFINSESYKVTKVGKPHNMQIQLNDGSTVVMQALPLTLENPMGNVDTFNFMDIKGNSQNKENAIQLANEKKMLWSMAKRAVGRDAKAKILQRINFIENFLFVNDNIEDNNHNLLQAKTIDFGYAMTVHKSQGSTFTNVLMDDVDIARAGFGTNISNTMDVIDLGEVNMNDGSNAELNSAEDVDLGDLGSAEPNYSVSSVSSQAINLRQQLEYVGVSRATDTVTIISNNVKKEGSPLHPKKNTNDKEQQHIEQSIPSSTSTITSQLISHLKSQGIHVFGRDAMAEFLKTHNLKYLQQAVAFGSNNPYENSKYRAKVPEILNVIKSNKYNNPGTDIVTLDSDNNKVLYLIDHSSDKELADNLKDGDGFGIRKVYNIDKLSENDIREITRDIAGDYQNSETAVRNWLQRLGVTSENLPGIDIDAAIKRGIGDNGQVDAKARGFGKQANKNRSGIDSREDKGVLPLYTTEQGEVYGFVDKDGNIYLDESKISPEHPIHEYTHLWDRAVQKRNPELWQRGIELMKKTSLWDDVLNADSYGRAWQSMNLSKEKLESLVASEVHARLVGENGEKLLNNLAKQQGQEGIISKLKQWILDMWKEVKATFGSWSKEYLDALTLKDFNHMTVRDFVDGTNLNVAQQHQLDQLRSNDAPASYEGFISPNEDTIFVFGSNPEGRHGAGAAKTAKDKFGAIYGQGEGLQGNAYALPTKDLRVKENRGLRSISAEQITKNIKKMYDVARQNPSKKFKVAYTHDLNKTSLNGYTGAEMIKMFKDAGPIPSNVIFSKNWTDHWNEVKSNTENTKKEESTVENPSFPEGQTQGVSLPSYEYFNDLYEDTPVDAAWKIPYLKELDAQLSGEKSEEENKNILNQMDNILQSTSKEEYLQELKDSEKRQVDKSLNEYDKLNKQIDNLLGNQDLVEAGITYHLDDLDIPHISASEIRHVAELVANELSDEISRLQKEEGLAQQWFPALNTKLDFKTATRKAILEAVGVDSLVNRVKEEKFNTETSSNPNYMDGITDAYADLFYDNWDAIMYLAADVFAFNEGFGIAKDFSKGNFTTTDRGTTDYDNFNDYSNDQDIAAENGEKDEQEHWQIENRTIDVLNSMSALVRQGIHECYQLNDDGSKVMSKWDIAERVNPRNAVNSILRWTQGSMSLEDMVKRLSDKQKQNPWLSQLITRLSDKSGNESDFQSQFYGVFSKHFQLYSVVLLENGKYYSMTVNSHPALTDVMNVITSQFKIGEHPLFGDKGRINAKLLGSENTIGKTNDFNLHKALSELQAVDKALKMGGTLDDTMSKTVIDNVMAVCKVFGFNVTEDMLSDIVNAESISDMTKYLNFMIKDLDKALKAQREGKVKEYDPFKYYGDNNIGNTLRNFLTPITDILEDTAVNAFYDSGKMYQSYVTPSFMTKLFNKFHLEGQTFEDFILDEYGSSEWFKFNKGVNYGINRGWRNEWLQKLATDENMRKMFDHKVELNFNKHNYMRNMSDAEYTLSLITEYFSEDVDKHNNFAPSWYRVPMQSNKPSSEFIKFYSYRGDSYKDSIVRNLHNIFLQELSRIQTVLMRKMSEDDSGFIKNFDTNGRKFCFLPVLNNYLLNDAVSISRRSVLRNEDGSVSSDNSRFAALLQKKVRGENALSSEEEVLLGKLADRVIRQSTEDRVQSILDSWEKNGILEAVKSIKGIYPKDFEDTNIMNTKEDSDKAINEWVREQVENFLWNDSLASKMILQLTIGDIAFYKDTEDLQKRLAQLHAPGIRGNIFATDYKGNRVSDGKYRTFILKDFDSFKSNIIANISEVFDRRIAAAPANQKKQLMALKESLVGEKGKYRNINVTDAQGYSSPSSYRKKALIFGKWSKEAEDIYQKLIKGEYTYTDLETAFQPLKPFVYSKLTKDMGVDNAPIHSMQVPFQAKNAEYLLIMADAILQGESLSRPNLLRAVYRVMEDSERLMPTKGIDTVQFESAIKSGLQGKMNIFQFRDMKGGEEAAYTFMMNQIFKEEVDSNTGERVYRDYNTDTFVHETSYEDYCLQQEVPEHFKEHSQAHGSQIRMITPSDLDLYTTDENGNQVDNYYEWTEPNGEHKRMKADEFRKEYEQTIADNIEESINNLSAELHLDSKDKRERNIALSKILQREIVSSPRYGIDLMQACAIDKETGEFRIPKGDPIQAKRIEQLINSLIKNRINKQKIAGGPIVQVSNFGTSRQLHIRFNDKQGNLMPLEEEYNPSEHKGLSYKDYCRKYQGGIAYFEVYAPIWSNELFEKFANPDGTINVDAINNVNPELLKMVSYRIPTEDKYSCAPMKVVGFMPREAGDAIMFPYELTEIDDSDFDVDKRYVMRKDIDIREKDSDDYVDELEERGKKLYKKFFKEEPAEGYIERTVAELLRNPKKFNTESPFRKALYAERQKLAYYTVTPITGRRYRDNKIIDMTYAVLTNEMIADKILNPGGFDAPKKMGYMVAAYKNPANEGISWSELESKSIKELKQLSYTDKDLTFADTQVQFYKQNSAAASLIGVFAVNKVAHATLEGNDILLDVSEICGDNDFTIAGTTFGGRMQIDKKYDSEGNLIGKTLGSLVSASADAVKDPILNLMNVNMTTAGMLNTMLRLGMTFNDAALFLSQDIIERLLGQFNKENLSNYVSLDCLINKWLDKYREANHLSDTSLINTEPLTKEELVEGLTSKKHEVINYKVLLAFQKMRALTDAMRKPTYATRFNSISSAVGPLIIDNLIIEHKMAQFRESNSEDSTYFYTADGTPVDISDVFSSHPVLEQFARTVDIAKSLFLDMPAGSNGFRSLLNKLPVDIANKMYADKKLLDQFSNFYQSYLLIQSGLVDSKLLRDYIEDFPKWFMRQNFKEKYPNNALIQAIRMNVSKSTGHPYLQINITGMDEQHKEELRSAWIDLHKDNPRLSKTLFDYSFFRAGVGFSPKTFMALVPTYVKERLQTEDGSASYVDVYRRFPTVVPELVIDQFIRNNWTNNKLVPWRGGKDTHYNINTKEGTLIVYRPEERADVANVSYFKTKVGKDTWLWKFDSSSTDGLLFRRVKSLGNNGEYLEMSTSAIKNSLMDTTDVSDSESISTDNEVSADMNTASPQESVTEESVSSIITKTEEVKNLSAIADLIMLQNPKLDHPAAEKRAEDIKGNERLYRKFLQNVFKHKGLNLSEEEAIEEFKKYC